MSGNKRRRDVIIEAIIKDANYIEAVDGDTYAEVYSGEAADRIIEALKDNGYEIVRFV